MTACIVVMNVELLFLSSSVIWLEIFCNGYDIIGLSNKKKQESLLSLWYTSRSLVGCVKDLLFSSEAAVCDLQRGLVERLGLVKAVTVRSAIHVGVQILLSLPLSAIEELAIAFIATGHGVGSLGDLQLGWLLEDWVAVTAAEVGAIVLLWAQVARTGRCREVVFWLVVSCSVVEGAGAVASASHLHWHVFLADQLRVKSIATDDKNERSVSATYWPDWVVRLCLSCILTQWWRSYWQVCQWVPAWARHETAQWRACPNTGCSPSPGGHSPGSQGSRRTAEPLGTDYIKHIARVIHFISQQHAK